MDKPDVTPKPHMHWDRKNALIGLIVLVVLVAAGLTWYLTHRTKAPTYSVPQYSGLQLVDEVNKKYGNHDYVGAIRLIEGQSSINDTATQLLLAGAYANSGDDTRALQIYERLESQQKLSEVDAATAADIAIRVKDYQKAIAYFKKAKERADPNAPDQIAVYDFRIAELEKKQ